ncbi:MAG TPA: YbaL family putative K(+) efflux transporter [Xanthobacteraceae bacterium]|nr:YbaL family putative K(+) efflux transporter [Xanthobacteraceae bacterium]
MPHNTPLISTIVVALALAWAFGWLAHRLKVPPLVGYLLAGIAIGPFTPGFVADQALANELSEIGVILLMFGVGLHFSLEDLLSVKAIAIPGAVVQIAVATALGLGFAWSLGWSVGAGIVFGLALSVASTVVLLRAMQERRLIETERGRIAVGWLIVEDLAMVLALVLLPALAPVFKGEGASLAALVWPVVLTLGKVAAFITVMLIVGKRVIPWVLHAMAHTGSRELFRLSVLVIALGAAYWSAELFGVSFALGAFFAGMILSESELSQRAAQETLPLRDAFAVLFFAAVGMLFNPMVVVTAPVALIITILIVVIGKSLAAFVIVRLFGHSRSTALTISASLAQIGEFSFILAGLGVSLALLPKEGSDLILAGAIFSILINPLLFAALDWYLARPKAVSVGAQPAEIASREPIPTTTLSDHVVLVGHGRVGSVISPALTAANTPFLVIENDSNANEKLKAAGIETINGNACDPEVIAAANLAAARGLLVSVPDAFEGGQIVEQARRISPNLRILARSHSEEETQHLLRHGATLVVMGEQEIGRAMLADIAAQPAMSRG